MKTEEFNDAMGKILGIKGKITLVQILKNIETGEVRIELMVTPNKNQIPKIMALVSNASEFTECKK